MSTTISSNRPGGGIKWRWPSVHPEGRKFLLIAGVVTLCFWLLGWEIAGWLAFGITIWVAAFFRDPARVTPTGNDVVIAPADGLVTQIAEVAPPPEIAGADGLNDASMLRVSIFMSVFDVHINRTPIAGTLRKLVYIPGKFLNADLTRRARRMSGSISSSSAPMVSGSASPRLPGWSRGASCRSSSAATWWWPGSA